MKWTCAAFGFGFALFSALLTAEERFAIEEVVGGVFVATPLPGSMAGANATFLVGERDVVVVDTHMTPRSSRALIAEIRRRTPLPIRFVIHTHWHPDHTQGTMSYGQAFPSAVVLAHRKTREDLATLGVSRLERDRSSWPSRVEELEQALLALPEVAAPDERAELQGRLLYERQFLEELNRLKLVLPTLTFSRSMTLDRPGQRLHLLFFGRGHTRGDAVVYLPRERVAIVGDLVTGGPPFARDGYPSDWIDTLSRLARLDVDVVVPGHGRVRRGGNVFDERRAFLESALGVVRRGIEQGLSPERITGAIDIDAFRDTFDPEPENQPWRGWMRMIVDRFILERDLPREE